MKKLEVPIPLVPATPLSIISFSGTKVPIAEVPARPDGNGPTNISIVLEPTPPVPLISSSPPHTPIPHVCSPQPLVLVSGISLSATYLLNLIAK